MTQLKLLASHNLRPLSKKLATGTFASTTRPRPYCLEVSHEKVELSLRYIQYTGYFCNKTTITDIYHILYISYKPMIDKHDMNYRQK